MNKKLGLNIIFGILLIIHAGCKQKSKDELKVVTRPLIHFPFVELTSIKVNDKELIFEFIDSIPFYNQVVSNQATLTYALQKQPDTIDYDKISFKIEMPNREGSDIEYSISKIDFQSIQAKFSDPKYRAFMADFLELNWSSRKNYEQKYMSLLDRTNMIFAHEIDKSFKDKFSNNSTWFGYDSFTVFKAYFSEVSNGENGIAHSLIESIDSSNGYLIETDKEMLIDLIEKHRGLIRK